MLNNEFLISNIFVTERLLEYINRFGIEGTEDLINRAYSCPELIKVKAHVLKILYTIMDYNISNNDLSNNIKTEIKNIKYKFKQ